MPGFSPREEELDIRERKSDLMSRAEMGPACGKHATSFGKTLLQETAS